MPGPLEAWNPAAYGPLGDLLQIPHSPSLGPGHPTAEVAPRLRAFTPETAFPGGLHHRQAAQACLSGLWLWFDYLDESHTISQDLPTPEGSYWHGIMHRREGDFWNSKYWFRRVGGSHPVFENLAQAWQKGQLATALDQPQDRPSPKELLPEKLFAGGRWHPEVFVDLCENALRQDPALASVCLKFQQAEWRALFDHCYQQACGRRRAD